MSGLKLSEINYPYMDDVGYTWIDPGGFFLRFLFMGKEAVQKAPCFICNRMTQRIDIDYHGYFCNSWPCIMTIHLELRGLTVEQAQIKSAVGI